ncbi:MAG: hypothetical protein RSD53_06290, partial [Algoriella sp.]
PPELPTLYHTNNYNLLVLSNINDFRQRLNNVRAKLIIFIDYPNDNQNYLLFMTDKCSPFLFRAF